MVLSFHDSGDSLPRNAYARIDMSTTSTLASDFASAKPYCKAIGYDLEKTNRECSVRVDKCGSFIAARVYLADQPLPRNQR